jgi:hypothetical protein
LKQTRGLIVLSQKTRLRQILDILRCIFAEDLRLRLIVKSVVAPLCDRFYPHYPCEYIFKDLWRDIARAVRVIDFRVQENSNLKAIGDKREKRNLKAIEDKKSAR